MYGKGILKGLLVTIKHFFETYFDNIRMGKKRYETEEGIAYRSGKDAKGIFTIKYPEERMITPEAFRFIPFLIHEEAEDGSKDIRCTSCGICAVVCPSQCIWIKQVMHPKTGRPVPEPEEFFIDVDKCMNCGFCSDYCPYDSIKMDHDFELANFDRKKNNIYDMIEMSKPVSYHASIHPIGYAKEEALRKEKEARKLARAQAKLG